MTIIFVQPFVFADTRRDVIFPPSRPFCVQYGILFQVPIFICVRRTQSCSFCYATVIKRAHNSFFLFLDKPFSGMTFPLVVDVDACGYVWPTTKLRNGLGGVCSGRTPHAVGMCLFTLCDTCAHVHVQVCLFGCCWETLHLLRSSCTFLGYYSSLFHFVILKLGYFILLLLPGVRQTCDGKIMENVPGKRYLLRERNFCFSVRNWQTKWCMQEHKAA